MDPATMVEALKWFTICNFICAFLQWHRNNFGIAKFMGIMGLVNVILIISITHYN